MRLVALAMGTWLLAAFHPFVPSDRIGLTVRNDNPLDVDVFAYVGDDRFRLGTVVTGSEKTFNMPAQATGRTPVRVGAEPVGSRERCLSPALSVSDGQRIRLTVGANLAQCVATVEAG